MHWLHNLNTAAIDSHSGYDNVVAAAAAVVTIVVVDIVTALDANSFGSAVVAPWVQNTDPVEGRADGAGNCGGKVVAAVGCSCRNSGSWKAKSWLSLFK